MQEPGTPYPEQPRQPQPQAQPPDQAAPVNPYPRPGEISPYQKVGNELSVTQPGEVTICDIKRHPIGIIAIYAAVALILIAAAEIFLVLLPGFINSSGSGQGTQIGAILFAVIAIFAMVYALIATKIYWGNRWVLTSDSLTQIDQTGLFSRKSAQLDLINIEDVTAEQNGLLTHLFNYGLLKAETAGQHGKFVFYYAPNPNYYAQKVLETREAQVAAGHTKHH